MIRSVVRYCVTPKSPDEPVHQEQNYVDKRTWSVVYDPDGTFPAGNRLGSREIFYGLINWNFSPGTVLLQLRDDRNRTVNKEWTVKIRHTTRGEGFCDAYHYQQLGRGSGTAWLMTTYFHRACVKETMHGVPIEQMVLVELT